MDALFCKYKDALSKFPRDLLLTQKEKLQPIFTDVNEQIRKYDEQYNEILKDLGEICSTTKAKESIALTFFKNLQDFVQLGLTMFDEDSEEWAAFDKVEILLEDFVEKKIQDFEQAEPLTKALLLQLTKSAWYVTSPTKSMDAAVKQVGGTLKNKTRKHKRT